MDKDRFREILDILGWSQNECARVGGFNEREVRRWASGRDIPSEAAIWLEKQAANIYLIWSHEHARWWGPDGCGYVRGISQAGRYSHAQALDICTRAVPGTSDRLGALPELPVRLVDVETVRDSFAATYPGQVGVWG